MSAIRRWGSGSPAVDSANTTVSGKQPADILGVSPYDDRGAYEFRRPATRYAGHIGTSRATTRHASDSVTVPNGRRVAAGDLVVATVQLSRTTATGAVTGRDSAGDVLRVASNISDRAGHRLVTLSGVARRGLVSGNKIIIGFPSASANQISVDDIVGVTTVDRHSAARGRSTFFSSGRTGTTSRPHEFVLAVTATFGGTR